MLYFNPNLALFLQQPCLYYIWPNWAFSAVGEVQFGWQLIGTFLNVSHLGFAIWNKQLYFREASSEYGKVVDGPLIDYLNAARKVLLLKELMCR